MAKIYTLSAPGETGWQFRFSWTGFALFWGDYLSRKTFQFHWAGYIPFYLVWGNCLGRRTLKLFRR